MKLNYLGLILSLAVVAGASGLSRAQTPADPAPHYGRAADNHIYGQKLLNQMKAANPQILHMGLHAIAPGETAQKMIACTDDTIGKADSPADLTVPAKNQSIVVAGVLDGAPRFKVSTPLHDAAGKIVGLAVFTFQRGTGTSPAEAGRCLTQAISFADELARNIPNVAELFKASSL